METRQTAKDLMDRIRLHPDPEISGNFLPSIFLGHTNKRDDNRMTGHQQKEIIRDFARGEHINLLVATSVAEEGIDIAACNFVVRVTAQMTPIRMIQSRGRARYPDSSYYVLCSNQADRNYVDSTVAAEREMQVVVEKMAKKTLGSYTCETTWDQPDPTKVKGEENKQKSLGADHPAFAQVDFKSKLNGWAMVQWGSASTLVYRSVRAGGTLHKPLWLATLTVTEGRPKAEKRAADSVASPSSSSEARAVNGDDHDEVRLTEEEATPVLLRDMGDEEEDVAFAPTPNVITPNVITPNVITFLGKKTATQKESEQWAAFMACAHYKLIQIRR